MVNILMNIQHASVFVLSFCAPLSRVSALTWDANGTGSGQTNGGGTTVSFNAFTSASITVTATVTGTTATRLFVDASVTQN
jgi:hypothetical protein